MRSMFFGSFLFLAMYANAEEMLAAEKVTCKERETPCKMQETPCCIPPDYTLNNPYYDDTSYLPYVYGECLYWQAVTEAPLKWETKEFNYSNTNITPNHTTDNFQNESLNYEFAPGFRLGVGYRIGKCDCPIEIPAWQIEAFYTQISTSASSKNSAHGYYHSVTGDTAYVALNPIIPAINTGPYLTGSADLDLRYKRMDVDFAWPIWLPRNVILRLMGGAVFSWIKNTFDAEWKETITERLNNTTPVAIDTTHLSWRWWGGGGLSGSVDIHIPLGKGFGFLADGGLSLLYGRFVEHEKYNNDSTASLDVKENKYHFHSFQPEFNVLLGFDYKYWFKDIAMLYVSAGWEATWWPYLNQFGLTEDPAYNTNTLGLPIIHVFDSRPDGFGFHGLTARAGVDF